MNAPAPPLLDVRNLTQTYTAGGRSVHALGGVSFTVERGSVVALVGESGSGKSTLARLITGLEEPTAGHVRLDGHPLLQRGRRHRDRAAVQMVFQDPFASLNPVHTVLHHVERPLRVREVPDARRRALRMLDDVGLSADLAGRLPHELSGGQRQRVGLARALAADPDLLVADEPTSMLDVSLRAEILDLLVQLATNRRLAVLLVTHDLASARAVADRILVLYAGVIVEAGDTEAVIQAPMHPYTRLLLAAARPQDLRAALPVRADLPVSSPTGCAFAARCSEAEPRCDATVPAFVSVGDRVVRCLRRGP